MEAHVAREGDRPRREGHVVVQLVRAAGHVEVDDDRVSHLPRALQREVSAGLDVRHRLAVQLDGRLLAPGWDAEVEREVRRLFRAVPDLHRAAFWIERERLEHDLPARGRQGDGGLAGVVEVHEHVAAARLKQAFEERDESSRAVGVAAVRVHLAVVLPERAESAERGIGGELRAVGVQRAKIGVVEGLLQFVRPAAFAGDRQELRAEAHPCGEHARFLKAHVGTVLPHRARIPVLHAGAAAADVHLRGDDRLGGLDGRLQAAAVARRLEVLQQTLVAAHHLVRLETGVLSLVAGLGVGAARRHGDARVADQVRAVRVFVHLRHDVLRECEVLRLLRAPVEPHDGFQHAARRHALVLAALHDVALAGSEHAAQVVAEARCRVERRVRAGEVVVEQEAEHRVLAAPDVPAMSTPRLFAVVAEIAVRQLGRQQVGDGRLDVGGEPRIAGHVRERRRRVHVLAPEFRLPVVLLGPPAVGVGEVDAVRLHDMVLDAAAQAVAHVAVEADVLEVGQRIRRGQRAPCGKSHRQKSLSARSRFHFTSLLLFYPTRRQSRCSRPSASRPSP